MCIDSTVSCLNESDTYAGPDLLEETLAQFRDECFNIRLTRQLPVAQREVDLNDQRPVAGAQNLVESLVRLPLRPLQCQHKGVLECLERRRDGLGRRVGDRTLQ